MPFLPLDRCPLWGTPLLNEGFPTASLEIVFNSPRAGGGFRIFADLQDRKFTPLEAAHITTWIIDQHLAGIDYPVVSASIVSEITFRPRLKFSEKIRRFFQFLSSLSFSPGDQLPVDDRDYPLRVYEAMAWVEATNDGDFSAFIELLEEDGLLKQAPIHQHVTLTSRGFARLEELETKAIASKQGFVAMWFDASVQSAYTNGIAPAIKDAGYEVRRIDEKDHVNDITDEILMEIRRSRFVVADFTSGFIDIKDAPAPRLMPCAGAYFEAGYALGHGVPVIWTARRDCIGGLHFDTNHHAHLLWDTPEDLRISLRNRIGAVIGPP